MHFSEEELVALKDFLCKLVATESDADPTVLADFMIALLQSDASRDVLYKRCVEELSVFLEEKTDAIVERVFKAIDNGTYMPKDTQPETTPAIVETKSTATPTTENSSKSKLHYGEDDEEDDEDDDTNFKRRSNKANTSETVITSSTSTTTTTAQKRSFSTDNDTDTGRLNKLQRQHPSTGPGSSLTEQNGGTYPGTSQRPPIRKSRKRCFDYDEKGYCMRGDFCPYQHGEDHLVVEAAEGTTMESLSNNSSNLQGRIGGGPMRIKGRGMNRNAGGPGGRGGSTNNIKRSEEVPYTSRYTPYSTRIVVENIPPEHCNIDAVTTFFGKFGKLVNLSVQADASRAFLQYATHQEAMAAYQSPAVIFNNRFVKVFWKKMDEEEERKEYLEQQRLASQPDPEAVKAKAAQLAKEREEKQKKQQEHLKKVLEFQKQKQQLMERQIEEHKKLMERLEQAPPGSKEREDIMSAATHLSDLIKSNQRTTTATSSSSSSAPQSTSISPPSTVEVSGSVTTPPVASPIQSTESPTSTLDAKRAEMERLKAKLASLEAAKLSGQFGSSTYGRGRGGSHTWATRGGRSFSLDNRKKATTTTTTVEDDSNTNKESLKPEVEAVVEPKGNID
ncbi:uncharacterized protein BX664DRAFT_141916 [Halteromyces radiatus]|uniref:uncharacterized protein n=1 Tax=Halteromyces radiatus TaxID=101107 RepID=UPI00222114D2|nr:uncharacterized protein BX664DRAFT_141916 [Halteromyces radiatus]KAI8089805.1 hypothetical protein BX664DRAFT_141916 [Halteromyces radiatus]